MFVFSILAATAWWTTLHGAEPAGESGPRRLTMQEQKALPARMQKLLPLHQPLAAPQAGDWLASQKEAGQTFRQYVAARPLRATARRRTIWIRPLGEFTADERKIVDLTREFLEHYFQLPVKIGRDVPLSAIPATARREHPATGEPQVLSTYVLQHVLATDLPPDAAVTLALTTSDLWPGEGWNFVFGQASFQDRVGVWSLHRFGESDQTSDEYPLTVRRTLKTAAHETAHMFSLPHCVYYECLLNGSNHLDEADRHPLWACPQCLAKLSYATGANPAKRFKRLEEFAARQNWKEEQEFWERSLRMMEAGSGTVGQASSEAR